MSVISILLRVMDCGLLPSAATLTSALPFSITSLLMRSFASFLAFFDPHGLWTCCQDDAIFFLIAPMFADPDLSTLYTTCVEEMRMSSIAMRLEVTVEGTIRMLIEPRLRK
jgi:hypothetical protein